MNWNFVRTGVHFTQTTLSVVEFGLHKWGIHGPQFEAEDPQMKWPFNGFVLLCFRCCTLWTKYGLQKTGESKSWFLRWWLLNTIKSQPDIQQHCIRQDCRGEKKNREEVLSPGLFHWLWAQHSSRLSCVFINRQGQARPSLLSDSSAVEQVLNKTAGWFIHF